MRLGTFELPSPLPDHPRLLLRQEDWSKLRRKAEDDGPSVALYTALRLRADRLLTEPPVRRRMQGRMLLMTARQALERMLVLATVANVSGDARYGTRAVAEILAVCRFSDWNPGHFLDTAELSLAVSIGYDWLHDRLTPTERDETAAALLNKGIGPSLDEGQARNWWLSTNENWAQVCHGGLGAAAIVLAGRYPECAAFVLRRALAAIPKAAASYAPDGAYPEGPMYWSYGTSYHVVLAAALQSLTGTPNGLDSFPGFAESADYINAVTAPSGDYFNYADCAPRRRIQAQLFWMAAHYGRPDWLAHDLATLARDLEEYRADPSAQYWYYDMVALALLWRKPAEATEAPIANWRGDGAMPVATFRWGERGCFLGVKGGSVGLSHSHMDVGSFVFEADGVRWAVDLGMQDYAGLEAAGVDLWNEREQDSQRWDVFRIGVESHNVLRFGKQAQRLFRAAKLRVSEKSCLVDLAGVYDDSISAASRCFRIEADGVSISDSWTASSPVSATTQWLTFAEVERNDGGILLTQDGKRLMLHTDGATVVEIEPLGMPVRPYDASNPGVQRISVHSERLESGTIVVRASRA